MDPLDNTLMSLHIVKMQRTNELEEFDVPNRTTFNASGEIHEHYIEEKLILEGVTSIDSVSSAVFDEGETRTIRKEIVLTVSAIVAFDQFNGDPDLNGVERNYATKEYMTRLTNFLYSDRLAICFGASCIPSPTYGLISAIANVEYGVLIDVFNGPKTLELNFDQVPGGEKFIMTWKVKYRVMANDNYLTNKYRRLADPDLTINVADVAPDISSELRLDIDREGDLKIIYSGTMYCVNTAQAMIAKKWLNLKFSQDSKENLEEVEDGVWEYVRYDAQMNGFDRNVSFNIDKTGRNVKFNITYSQIASNSAYPLGIKDLSFIHSLESGLAPNGPLSAGSGFTKWKNTFTGHIKIPHRMKAIYAWYIMHMLVMQRLKRSTIAIRPMSSAEDETDTSEATSNTDGSPSDEGKTDAGKDSQTDKKYETTAIPLRLKFTHDVFSRRFDFNIEFLNICPLSKIFYASCFFDRLNNDYNKVTEGGTKADSYVPDKLSVQWKKWQKSVDPGGLFDPVTERETTNKETVPYMDNSGTFVIETDHFRDPLEKKENDEQITELETVNIDPYENDPAYTEGYLSEIEELLNLPIETELKNPTSDDTQPEGEPNKPIVAFNVNRSYSKIRPELSWLHYEQEYVISEELKTLSVEGLASMREEDYSNKVAYEKYINPGVYPEGHEQEGEEIEKADFPSMKHITGMVNPVRQDLYEEEENGGVEFVRKTYSDGPPRYFVTVRGHALRAKYKIPIPEVISIAGEPAVKVGKANTLAKVYGSSGEMPVHLLIWEQTYTVDKNVMTKDIMANIETTGASILYS